MNVNQQILLSWGRLQPCTPHLSKLDLFGPIITFGTSENCDVKLPTCPTTSREHFCLIKESAGVYLIDFSKNGSYLNTQPVIKGAKTMIHSGDVIGIGHRFYQIYIFKLIPSALKNNAELPENLRNNYALGALIKKSAFSQTNFSFDMVTGKTYLLKELTKSNRLKDRADAMRLRLLNHPCLLKIKELIVTEFKIYLVSDFMRNGNMQALVKRGLSKDEAKFIFYQVALAVQYLHSCHIVHGRLKPENVFVLTSCNPPLVQVTDFWLNQLTDEEATEDFTAPELLDAHNSLFDAKVDVWSLGEILFYMIFRALPFKGLDQRLVVTASLFAEAKWNLVPAQIKNLLEKMLTVNSEDRINIDAVLAHPWILQDSDLKNLHEPDKLTAHKMAKHN